MQRHSRAHIIFLCESAQLVVPKLSFWTENIPLLCGGDGGIDEEASRLQLDHCHPHHCGDIGQCERLLLIKCPYRVWDHLSRQEVSRLVEATDTGLQHSSSAW